MKKTTSTTDAGEFTRRLEMLRDAAGRGWLAQGGRGIEKESLRVQADGALAQSPHPIGLGAALTHPEVTTDYSEALLEFITPPVNDPVDAIDALRGLHRYVHRRIGDELLWDLSMPGTLPPDSAIPIAYYGQSNLGRFKHVYRRGLAVRYGRAMQCIAGIHYNFSFHESFWSHFGPETDARAPDDRASLGYMALIRNYRRYSWLLLYLFGASPALDKSFFAERNLRDPSADPLHGLEALDEHTLYLPYATSLRMSDLGYHNRASREIRRLDLTSLSAYLSSVAAAIRLPYAPYEDIGTHQNGDWVQLNTNLLQIENELYATIRPKRVGKNGERILHTLARGGIQYVEVRCLDIDPFEDVGITANTVRFIDAFLTLCALEESPIDAALQSEADANFLAVAKDGRRPGKTLTRGGESLPLADWAAELMTRVEAIARVLDGDRDDAAHLKAVDAQRAKLTDAAQLPSARVLAATQAAGSFAAFGLQQSRLHAAQFLSESLPDSEIARLDSLATDSIAKQTMQEAADTIGFDDFVAAFGRGMDNGQTALQDKLQDA